MKEIGIVLLLIAVAIVLFSIRIILIKDGKFSSQHVSENKKMKENGIGCVMSQDRQARKAHLKKIDTKQL